MEHIGIDIDTGTATERVAAKVMDTPACTHVLVFAHGAGAGMDHEFMEHVADRLLVEGIATLRFQFPYMAKRRRAPDRQPLLLASVRAAVVTGQQIACGRPVLAGGKSMGGRMTSIAAAGGDLGGVSGLVFFGFPLHAAGKPSRQRAAHLADVRQPMLFLQGTRDRLADLDMLTPVCHGLGGRASLEIVDGADHSFRYLKSAGKNEDAIYAELAGMVRRWCNRNRVTAK